MLVCHVLMVIISLVDNVNHNAQLIIMEMTKITIVTNVLKIVVLVLHLNLLIVPNVNRVFIYIITNA